MEKIEENIEETKDLNEKNDKENDKENSKKNIKQKIKEQILQFLKVFFILNIVNIMEYVAENNTRLKIIIKAIQNFNVLGANKVFYIIKLANMFNKVYFENLLIIFCIYIIIFSICNRRKISLIITSTGLYIFEVANYIVDALRGNDLTISDLLSIKTALNVTTTIDIKIEKNIIIATILFFVIIILIFLLHKNKNTNKIKIPIRICRIIISIFVLVVVANAISKYEMIMCDIDGLYETFGTEVTLLRMIKDLKVDIPENYSKTEVENLLSEYKDENQTYQTDVNVIVVMNESFSDFYNNEIVSTSEDNIPYFHELQKESNVITGTLHSEKMGGNTANMEYELLTQNTTAFLPTGSVPYQQYISNYTQTLATKMNNLNYTTYAIHTWNKTGYNREKIYNLFGFKNYKFKEDYDDLENGLNNYTTDKSSYSKIVELLENKQKTEKLFSFNVTIANHMPYKNEDKNATTYSSNKLINSYLQVENQSDEDLKYLIDYLKSYDEKVILLFFGDHQPYLKVNDIDNDLKYEVPYLIWANYDIDTKEYGDTSANYLQSILLEVANLPKDEYTNYLLELRKQIPVITANYYIGNDGNKYSLNDEESPYYEKILEYKKVSYYKIFDSE